MNSHELAVQKIKLIVKILLFLENKWKGKKLKKVTGNLPHKDLDTTLVIFKVFFLVFLILLFY